MNRFLVVGCGGSGGKTLAYLMDQLRSDMAQDGVNELPLGWQFVFVDVPAGIDNGPDGLGSVVEQGGRYVGMGPKGGSYADLDQTVSQMLTASQTLEAIGTWAPAHPENVHTPISVGAGQYRAIGRMILLARAGEVQRTLAEAWGQLSAVPTLTSMSEASRKVGTRFNANKPAVILVVASMAGGSGASMALDVCRLLTQVPGVNPRLMSMFMVSADIFDSLPPADRSGVRANALAMLGEIVASQAGSARRHDVSLLEGLGYGDGAGEPIPFARVFPISRLMGAQRTMFGDGSMNTVYRGLARGLAGLMTSDVASNQFIDFDLGNTGSKAANPKYLGWGAQPDPLPWGSFGFASLSMGRERYAEYAAQRIARTCVDRLLDGHLQQENRASGNEQVKALVDSQWSSVCVRLQLPDSSSGSTQLSEMGQWMTTVALPRNEAEQLARQVTNQEFTPYVPAADGQGASQWREALQDQSSRRRQPVTEAVSQVAYQWAFDWLDGLQHRTEALFTDAISKLGLAYADALLARLNSHLSDFVVPGVRRVSGVGADGNVAELSEEVKTVLSVSKGAIVGGAAIVDRVVNGVMAKVRTQLYRRASTLMADGVQTFVTDVIQPLESRINEMQLLLERARSAQVGHDGLAQLATNQYSSWPSNHDSKVPQRFDEANNEVLITTSREFASQYSHDLRDSATSKSDNDDNSGDVLSQVIRGRWATTGGEVAPERLIETVALWRSRAFPTNPRTGDSTVPSRSQYDIHVRPAEVLARARTFVGRKGEAFDQFCATSLHDFLNSPNIPESMRDIQSREVVTKFGETLALAIPLISVDEQSVQLLHGTSVEYRYKFSAVPFKNLAITRDLEAIISSNPNIDASSLRNFTESLTDLGSPRRIDVFGSYPLYSPLVFDSILAPVVQEWNATAPAGRSGYWTHRRARPLDAALAMGDVERGAMVAGWYIGQIIGELRIPDPPYRVPVQIWDPERSLWQSFPHPLLTPPGRFRKRYDWLPAVLESHLLAVAAVQKAPVMSSLRPYILLRELYDDAELGPVGGIVERSAIEKLTTWLAVGSALGMPSRIPSLEAATTPEERRDAAKDWLIGPSGPGQVAQHFVAGLGPNGHASSSALVTRAQAADSPYFRDLAPDVAAATMQLVGLLDQAYAGLAGDSPRVGVGALESDVPEGGVF